jgi:hypothetical protein
MKPRLFPVALLLAVLLPSLANAMTMQDVVKLTDSKVGEDVIISQIEASGEVFKLTVDDILELKKAGVSDRVISFMINTGKDGEAADNEENDADVRYRSNLDDRYRTGYHDNYDPYWNVYLSWGYGGYYDPWYYSSWWPSYGHYYYPVNCYSSYWPYYPPRHHHGHDYDGAGYRQVKQGRQISGRGGSSSRTRIGGTETRSADNPSSRSYKGRGSSSRGSTVRQTPPPANSGRTTKEKSPAYGGRGSASPPPPSSGSQQGSTQSSPPPQQQSGRTKKS